MVPVRLESGVQHVAGGTRHVGRARTHFRSFATTNAGEDGGGKELYGHLEGTVSAREHPSAQTKMKQHPPLHHPTWRVPDAVRGKERTPVNDAGECGTVRRPASVITG